MQIYVNVVNQKLMATTSLTNFVEGSQIFVQFTFNLDDAWNDLVVFAQFQQGENAYNVFLDDNNSVYLPTEIVAGKCNLLLYGSGSRDNDTVIATTNYLTLTLGENKIVQDAQSTDITQSLYDQMISKFIETKDQIMSQFRDAKDQMTSDFRAMINGVYDMFDIDDEGILDLTPESGEDSERPDEQVIVETIHEYFEDHPVSDYIPDESISEEKLDSDLQRKINEQHVVDGSDITDGTISKGKLDSNVKSSLDKADNSWQKSSTDTYPMTSGSWESIYDPLGYGHRPVPQDPYGFAQGQDTIAMARMRGIAQADVQSGNQIFNITDTTGDPHSYTGLDSALLGIYGLANAYTRSALSGYEPINIVIVDPEEGLPETGATRTFYLIPDGNRYKKYWYIKDEDGVSKWDEFGSSSTVVVNSLPTVGEEDVDYILSDNGEYQYYKYINNQWALIAGSTAVLISCPVNKTGTTTLIISSGVPTSEDIPSDTQDVAYLDTDTMFLYTLRSGSWGEGVALVQNPSVSKDYFVEDKDGKWYHFRYIDSQFKQIGSSAYTRDEVDKLLSDLNDNISERMSGISSSVSELTTKFNNLANLVKDVTYSSASNIITITYMDDSTSALTLDKGIDIDHTAYNIDDDSTLHFYDSNGNELEDLKVVITGGGGGGTTGGSASIDRVTDANVDTIYGDELVINYTCRAVDSSGDAVGSGVGTLYVGNVPVESGFTVLTSDIGAANAIDVGKYLAVGSNSVKISVSVDVGGENRYVATKTWTVNAVNMYLAWSYTDDQVNTSAITDRFTPYGALSKSTYTFVDVDPIGFNPVIVTELPNPSEEDVSGKNYFLRNGNNYTHYVYDDGSWTIASGYVLDVNTTTRSGIEQSITIPMLSHGSHVVARFMIGEINDTQIQTAVQVHDMVFVEAGETAPIIATSFNTANMVQYNTVQIPIVVYDPSSTTTTVVLREDGNVVSTWTGVDRTVQYWNYSPTDYGQKELTITCGSTTKTININVTQLDIDEAEVTGYDFRFKASELATNEAVRSWHNADSTVDITFSPNFDWVNGGLHTETDEDGHIRQYFCVRAGTTATFNYNLFGTAYDPKQFGKNFKFIFKAVNCRTYDASVLRCMDDSLSNNGVGLVMTANDATLSTVNESLTTHYYKDTYIEFEANIHPMTEYRYLQFWMDGSHDTNILYSEDDTMQQVSPVGITVGSPNCDVYIYMMKAYPTYLTNENELSNFIMDAPNAYEMVDRYNRNDILNESGEIDYTKLANANPDLRVWLLDLNRMSTGKKDNVVAYTARQIYNSGGSSHCFTVNNACITIQGTSSVGYLESAGNMDVNFKYGREFTSDNESFITSAISFDDGTSSQKGYGMTEDSIPVDYLNIKVNVASSENANNACIADWYNIYQPWRSFARRKNAKARDTIEFTPGVVFIRDRSGNLFSDSTSYHLYGICDIGNSKKNTKVFHDTTNPIAACVEVANNTSLPCLMSSDEYTWNADDEATVMELDPESGELKEQKVFEFRYSEDYTKEAENAWDRFVAFMYDHNPNLATNESLGRSVTFEPYTFKGNGTYDTSAYDSDEYQVVYLYGYGLPDAYGYAATDYVTDTSGEGNCHYYINYSNNTIYSSNGTAWTALATLTWTRDANAVLAGTSIGTYAGTYTTDSYEYRMAYLLEHCEEYMVMDPVIYHFVFIESFLMTDNVAKNTFWSSDDLVHWEPSKDYDNDRVMSL